MKLTKETLKKIIKEELGSLSEVGMGQTPIAHLKLVQDLLRSFTYMTAPIPPEMQADLAKAYKDLSSILKLYSQ